MTPCFFKLYLAMNRYMYHRAFTFRGVHYLKNILQRSTLGAQLPIIESESIAGVADFFTFISATHGFLPKTQNANDV